MELTTTIDNEVVEQKKKAWGDMGVVVFKAEMSLQAQAQLALSNIKHPTKIEEVPDAEAKLKELGVVEKSIETQRKAITSKFETVTQRLMEPEKSFKDPKNALQNAIITVKRDHEAAQKKINDRLNELKDIRTFYSTQKINIETTLQNKVINLVARCYEKALTDDIALDKIEEYKSTSVAAVTDTVFNYNVPPFNILHATKDELDGIISEVLTINQSFYVQSFQSQLKEKFSDYEVAFNNKAQALKLSQEEETKQLADVSTTAAQQQVGVNLEAASTPVSITTTGVKALKKCYEVDMPETVESVLKIFAAFSANIHLCLPKLKVNKWFAFTPGQAANVLGKCKNDDNNFSPSGITFKEVDKL